jgi:hypothetical protein
MVTPEDDEEAKKPHRKGCDESLKLIATHQNVSIMVLM